MRLEFSFVVGEVERHTVEFAYDQFLGRLTIKVDGRRIVRDWRDLLPFGFRREYRFAIGDLEHHDVTIRKTKQPLPYAGVRPQTVTVFVDGRQTREHRTR